MKSDSAPGDNDKFGQSLKTFYVDGGTTAQCELWLSALARNTVTYLLDDVVTGPHCRRMCRSERRQHLREQYFFECQCSACSLDVDHHLYFEVCITAGTLVPNSVN